MSNVQFHNKLHRANHFTVSAEGFPDSATDPIASKDQPFVGVFFNSIVSNVTGSSNEWQALYSTTKTYSADWNLYPSVSTTVKTNSSNWNDGYNFYNSLLPVSSNYESSYTTLTSNSSQYFLTNLYGVFTNEPQIYTQAKNFAGATLTPSLSVNRIETFLIRASSIPISGGQIFGTGNNLEGQIGIVDISSLTFTGVVSGIFDDISVCCVGNHTLALSSGSLFVTGRNDNGQLGLSSIDDSYSYVLSISTGILGIAAGGSHTVVLSSNNRILVTGSNSDGQLGIDNTSLGFYVSTFYTPITGNYIKIAAGNAHTLALSSTNNGYLLFATGKNDKGQLGLADNFDESSFTTVLTGYFTDIACGLNFSLALSSGSIFSTGHNSYCQLGLNDGLDRNSFTLACSGNFSKIACGAYHAVALSGNKIFVTGNNTYGQLGTGFTAGVSSFTPLIGEYTDIACGAYHTLALSGNTVFVSGRNDNGQLGDGTTIGSITFFQPTTGLFNKIAGGETFSLALPLSTQTLNSIFTTVSSFSGTMYWTLSSEQNAFYVLTASYTEIKNPIGMLKGGEYYLTLKQNISGDRKIKFGSKYVFTDGTDVESDIINLSAFGATVYRFISDGQYMYGKVRKYIFGYTLMYVAGPGIILDPNPTDSAPGDQFLSDGSLTIFDLAPYYTGLGLTIIYGE